MKKEILWSCLLTIGVLALSVPSAGQDNSFPKSASLSAVSFGISLPLRELVKLPQPAGRSGMVSVCRRIYSPTSHSDILN